jgi:hypothetical protein
MTPDELRAAIREGLRFLVIQPRGPGDKVYQRLVEAARETDDER